MKQHQPKSRLFGLWKEIFVSVIWVYYSINEFLPHAYDSLEAFCVVFLPPVILLILGMIVNGCSKDS